MLPLQQPLHLPPRLTSPAAGPNHTATTPHHGATPAPARPLLPELLKVPPGCAREPPSPFCARPKPPNKPGATPGAPAVRCATHPGSPRFGSSRRGARAHLWNALRAVPSPQARALRARRARLLTPHPGPETDPRRGGLVAAASFPKFSPSWPPLPQAPSQLAAVTLAPKPAPAARARAAPGRQHGPIPGSGPGMREASLQTPTRHLQQLEAPALPPWELVARVGQTCRRTTPARALSPLKSCLIQRST
mmetsp:Transcript_85135/g.189182  ORF Transcript_85135/g.189182 Transcript_85135/m.189182 type:complete len:249 (-) Transcript_85135:2-748(-)